MLPTTARGELAQDLSLVASILLLLVMLEWCRRNRTQWRYGVPTLTVAVHTLVYYVAVILVRLGVLTFFEAVTLFSDWSALLRLHTLLVLLLMEAFRLHATVWRDRHTNGSLH